MKKLLTIVLAVAMMISSSGITIAGMVCTKGGAKRAAMCQLCQKSKAGRSTDKKSCCQKTAKFFAVKTNYSKPVQAGFSPLAVLAILVVLASALITRERATVSVRSSTSSPSSQEKCARTSRLRI